MKLKDIINEPNFCAAPWFHAVINPWGSVRPCNDFHGAFGKIQSYKKFSDLYNNDKFVNLRNTILEGKIHEGCVGCREKEKRIAWSKRISILKQISNWDLFDTELTSISPTKNIIWLDMRLSNKCNLKCRHCYSSLSSKWAEDIPALKTTDIGKAYINNTIEYQACGETHLTFDHIADLANNVGELRCLEFKGGEPFLNQKLINQFINYLKCDLKNIKLYVVTNGTVKLSDLTLDTLSQCKQLIYQISVEGTGNMFKYIRGIPLESIIDNIKIADTLDNVWIGFRITQMVYNIFEFPKVYDWIRALNLRHSPEINIQNYVVKPDFLNPLVLPLEVRMEARETIMDFIKKHPGCDSSIPQFYKTLGKDSSDKNMKLLIMYTKAMDKIRGMSINEAEPRIGRYIL